MALQSDQVKRTDQLTIQCKTNLNTNTNTKYVLIHYVRNGGLFFSLEPFMPHSLQYVRKFVQLVLCLVQQQAKPHALRTYDHRHSSSVEHPWYDQ